MLMLYVVIPRRSGNFTPLHAPYHHCSMRRLAFNICFCKHEVENHNYRVNAKDVNAKKEVALDYAVSRKMVARVVLLSLLSCQMAFTMFRVVWVAIRSPCAFVTSIFTWGLPVVSVPPGFECTWFSR